MQNPQRIATACAAACALAVAAQAVMMALPPATGMLPGHTSMLTLHLLLELFAVVIAVLIVVVSWHTFDLQTDHMAPVLVGGFTVVACTDLAHALVYEGMPAMLGESSTERAIFFWLMGRSAETATLALVALGRVPTISRRAALAAGAGLSLLLLWGGTAGLGVFPRTFVAGSGVTPFKAVFELVLCAANLAIALLLWRRARQSGQSRLLLMATSAWVIGIGEISFTAYATPSDFQNVFGHFYKIAGYALLYASTFIASLRAPFERLRESETRASEGEQRLRMLADNLPDSVVYQVVRERDGTMRFVHLSEAIEKLTGVGVAEALADATALYSLVDAADRGPLAAAEARSAATMSVFDVSARLHDRAGRRRWVRLASAPRRLADGRICWDGVMTDITEQRAAELEVREREAMLAAVIDAASDAVIGTDADGRITLFNPAAERIFGHRREAMIGRPLDALLPETERQRHGAALAAFAASGGATRRMGPGRVQGRHADGSPLQLEASISHATAHGRQLLTATLHDVTERVRSERALAQYQAELKQLAHELMAQEKATSSRLAQALHDQLGQTLAAMRIDYVAEASFADPQQATRHARVDRLIDQAVAEVRQVLAELRPTVLDEQGLAAAIDNELRTRSTSAPGLRIVLDVAPALVAQRFAPDVEYAVFMVMREAVGNALRHARATTLRVTLDGDTHALRLEVADDGVGLPADALAARPGHLGMVGMRERSIAIGARFEVRPAAGGGTVVALAWEDAAAPRREPA